MSTEPWKKKVDLFRSRFVAREDRFLINKTFSVKENGAYVEKKMAMPSCKNFGSQDVCRITRREGGCAGCDAQVYQPLTDEVIWRHLSGEQEIVLLMNREEGIRFGATDFDRGTVFEDAKAIRDLSQSLGIPAYIAKSTRKGYHVYWFFSDFVKPHEFTSFIRYLYEELGFYQRYHVTPEAGLPEVFPKQTNFTNKDTGNGIKVPMCEPRMREGRNCWMDDDEAPIPFDQQWDFLELTKTTTPADFQRIITEKNVEILQAPASRDRQRARKMEGREEGVHTKIKPFGDFWSIVEGCPSMQQYWAKDNEGRFVWDVLHPDPRGYIPYPAYLSSIMLAVMTTNGVEEITKRWPDQDTLSKINGVIEGGYRPYSCSSMQAEGVCMRGVHPKHNDHCLKRLPPTEYIEGVRKVNPEGLPEAQWPDPSPIRFAADRHLSVEDIIERLEHIFKAQKARAKGAKKDQVLDYLPPNPSDRIDALLKCARRLGSDEYTKVSTHLKANKLMKATELKAFEKEASKADATRKDHVLRKTSRSFKSVNGNEYFQTPEGYRRVWYDNKGMRMEVPITNFYILIHEEVIRIRVADGVDLATAEAAEDRDYRGTIYVGNERLPYNVNFREWTSSADAFFRTLNQYAGSKLQYSRSDYDHIRNCLNGFSQEQITYKRVTGQIGYHLLKGREVYITRSVIIDKESIRPNDEYGVVEFDDDSSKPLDFKLISEEELRDLGNHIITDYFACNHKAVAMSCFAHAMAAVMLPQVEEAVGYNKSPVLWLAGSFSKGKTFVAEAAQNFFGVFKMLQNASGTAKSKVTNAHNFRHAFMLIDDYKKKFVDMFGVEMPQFIQMVYDRTGRSALQKDGRARKNVDRARGLVCVSAEDSLENESSAASRIINIDVDLKENFERGGEVKKRRDEYCGFTPYFVQYVLNLHPEEIREMWGKYYKDFRDGTPATDKDGSNRVCENLTLNMAAFRFSMDMLVARGAIPEVRRDELCRIHFASLCEVRKKIMTSIADASGANVFLKSVGEIIQDTASYQIIGLPATATLDRSAGCKPIGFWRSKTPDLVYLFPKVIYGLVSDKESKSKSTIQAVNHVARQLYEMGAIDQSLIDRNSGRYVVQMRSPIKEASVWVWPVRCEHLGIEIQAKDKTKARRENSGNQATLAVVSDEEP